MIVEPAPIVPRDEDRAGVPRGRIHDRVHQAGDVVHAGRHAGRRVFAEGAVGNDPAHLRQFAVLRIGVELGGVGEAAELGGIVLDGWKRGEWIPESVGGFVRIDVGHAAIGGAGGLAAVHVISPIDLARAQELGDFRKGKRHRFGLAGADVSAALRRQHIQMGRRAVGGDGFEEAVLKNIEAGVVPVVGKLAIIVPSHDIARLLGRPRDEAVHQPAVDRVQRVDPIVRAALVDQAGVVGGGGAGATGRTGNADAGRYAFGAGIGSEVVIEAAILLHDEHEVLDLFESRRGGGRRGVLGGGAAHNQQCRQNQGQQGKTGAETRSALHDTPSKPRRHR